ncbi:Coenzyme F420 hydrogenase/dehydrogenase, beta subunit C-terminal domain [Shewanella sp. 10N.286.52.C2]|uniref:Coenzyme F420 hydrogenase/dehydrogenase, beta subunit C-terminal domain n=1 Tax=Shewanella sp. 10N.286.52.C2 TaxID=1880838 RepID=UPI0018E45D08|nr:Coenzyme F420 hydrogenase/dehydrogenase, beta subunit C-terminal domain [Shewanella sp. 10N.286.52.C2]
MRLNKVVNNKLCTGCGLCTDNAMEIDKEGYIRPGSNLIDDELSRKSCPGINIAHYNNEKYDPTWGPIKDVFTGYSNNSEVLKLGSSGGGITSLLLELISNGLVDHVIQVGVSENNPIVNETKISTTFEDIIACTGSRYSPSSPLDAIRSVLNNDKVYGIVGKPCDIAAVRAMIAEDKSLEAKFPYLISFFCAGVPSLNGTQEILSKLKVKPEDLISFRYRGDGWPGLTKAITKNGLEKTMTYNESWGSILNRHLQSRCKICADGIGEAADIVCADAWHENDKDGYPSFEEANGRSLFVTRTKKGEELLDMAVMSGNMTVSKYQIANLQNIQPYQEKRKKLSFFRHLALRIMGRPVTTFKGYNLFHLGVRNLSIMALRDFIGTIKRVWQGRL